MNGVLQYLNFRLCQGQVGRGGWVGHSLSDWYYTAWDLEAFDLVAVCWELCFCISQLHCFWWSVTEKHHSILKEVSRLM